MKHMKERVGKKGLSPIIASVLLILLVIVLAGIIFIWAKGFIGEQLEKFNEPIEDSCDRIVFDASRTGIDLKDLKIRNTGDVDIRYLEIRMSRGGESITKLFDVPVDAGKFEIKSISFFMTEDGDGSSAEDIPEEIIVYPALLGTAAGASSNKPYTCLNNGITLQANDI
jgi:flagellin-like protein